METIWQILIAEALMAVSFGLGFLLGKNMTSITKTVSSVEAKLPHPASTAASTTPTVPSVPTTH